MATVAASPIAEHGTPPTVRACYALLEVMRAAGMTDFTDGKYVAERNDRTTYLAAQHRQAEYLLDQARCGAGTRLLDIGCGYGRLLTQAAARGASAVGITISPQQVADCRRRGLTVYEWNYRDVFSKQAESFRSRASSETSDRRPDHPWEHAFDALVANGSLEHFVQPADAAAGRDDVVYTDMFAICRRLLADGGRLVTTAIHFRRARQFDPAQILRGRSVFAPGSDDYQFASLAESFGGWYPEPGQLERCACGCFELVNEEDGTRDYRLTSEYWLRQFKWSLAFDPRVWYSVARTLWRLPGPAWRMLRLQLWDESWAWQFRPPAPMRLLRQTWLAR